MIQNHTCTYCHKYFIQHAKEIIYDTYGNDSINLYYCSKECRIEKLSSMQMMNSNEMRNAIYGNERYNHAGYEVPTGHTAVGEKAFLYPIMSGASITSGNKFYETNSSNTHVFKPITHRSITELFKLNTKEEFNNYLTLLISENI